MKTKKLIALAMTAIMMLTPVSAFASQNNLDPSQDQTINGGVNYVNTTVYKVTLPTTAGMSFKLDPQGLSSLDGGTYSASDAGLIIGTGEMFALNESSVDLTLTCGFYVEDSTGTLTLKGASDTIDDAKQEIKLAIQTSPTQGGSYTDAVYVTSQSADAKTTHPITLGAADYEFTASGSSYTYTLTPGSGKSVYMKIAGNVATDYKWDDYTKASNPATMKLHAIFELSDPSAATTISGSSYSVSGTNNYTISWKDGATKSIKSIVGGSSPDNYTVTFETSSYSLSSDKNTLTINGAKGKFGSAAINSTRYLKVTFGDDTYALLTVSCVQ